MPATRSSRRGSTTRRRRRALLPRHHRQPREPRHAPRRGGAHRRAVLHAADRRRRRARRSRTSARCCWPAPTRSRSTPRRSTTPEFVARGGGEVRQPVHRRRASTPRPTAPGRFEVFTHGGRRPTGLDAVDWARRMDGVGAGEILLTSMDRDGTQAGFDLPLTRAVADAVRRAGDRLGRRRHPRASGRGRARGPRLGGAGRLDLPFRHLHRSREAKAHMAAAGIPVRLDETHIRRIARMADNGNLDGRILDRLYQVDRQPARRRSVRRLVHGEAVRQGHAQDRAEGRRGSGRGGGRGGRAASRERRGRRERRPALSPARCCGPTRA